MTSETPVERSAAGEGNVVTQSSDTRQYVTFVAGDEVFAVEMAPVQEIIRVPTVVRVPLSPPTLEGLANLRGKVLPIVSLRRALGFAERESDDASRAVVIDLGQPLGFVVDRVASVVGVEASKIEGVQGISGTVNTNCYRPDQGHWRPRHGDGAELRKTHCPGICPDCGHRPRPGQRRRQGHGARHSG